MKTKAFLLGVVLPLFGCSSEPDTFSLKDHVLGDECSSGIQAYDSTVHQKVMKDCVGCHNGNNPRAPRFALPDARDSYYAIKSFVNFVDVPNSTLRIRAGNGHCGSGCNLNSGNEMESLIGEWWTRGENQCLQNGRIFSSEVSIPTNLPTREDGGFVSLAIPLDSVSSQFVGYSLTFDVQRFSARTDTEPGSYRLRKPRIQGKNQTVYVKNLRIFINRKFDNLTTAYSSVDQKFSGQEVGFDGVNYVYPVMSANHLIAVQETVDQDKISVSFEAANVLPDALRCKDMNYFNGQVLKVVENRQCYFCHGGGPQNLVGRAPANHLFPMAVAKEELCSGFIQRTETFDPANSSIIKFPQGKFQLHAEIFSNDDLAMVIPEWTAWFKRENQ